MHAITNINPSIFKRLFMVRHGESTCNTVNRIAGNLDAPLSALGRAQAIEAARNKSVSAFDRVFVSPLSRAQETARIILDKQRFDISKVAIDARLMERDFGSYTLENKSRLQKQHGIAEYERAMNHHSDTMQGGESFGKFSTRVEDFFFNELLPALKKGETVLVVSHKYVVELICRIILNRRNDDAYDLRLPNSEILSGDKIESYLRKEKKVLNMLYDWMVVNHAFIFIGAIIVGVLCSINGFRSTVSPHLLFLLLLFATTITMCRVEVESAWRFLSDKTSIALVAARYLAIPLLLYGAWRLLSNTESLPEFAVMVLLAAPSAAISLTVSRCIGGLVLPTLSYKILSSLAALLPLTLLLAPKFQGGILLLMTTTLLVAVGTGLIPYFVVKAMRRRKPIWTAKFGERSGHIAVLCLSVFIVLAASKIDLSTFGTHGYVAIGTAIALRILAAFLAKFRKVSAIDDYVAMSYPNVFVVIILSVLVGETFLQQVALWFMLPLFLCSAFDAWYAGRIAVAPSDKRLFRLLEIPISSNG